LESFHYVIKVLCHTQNFCWQGYFEDYKIRMCFLLLTHSPNVFNFIMGSNILHKKRHMCLCIGSFEWMLLILIFNVFNGSKGSKFVIMVKNKCVHLTTVLVLMQKMIILFIIWVMFGFNIDIQSQKLHLKYSFGI
jgi:hypothetical protein